MPKDLFYVILLATLVFAALRIYFWSTTSFNLNISNTKQRILALLAGSVLGLTAGIVGFGGGIYLVLLILPVLAGGILGSYMGSTRFQPRTMEQILGAVIIVAVFFLTKRVFFS